MEQRWFFLSRTKFLDSAARCKLVVLSGLCFPGASRRRSVSCLLVSLMSVYPYSLVSVRSVSLSNMVSRHVSFVHDTRIHASVFRDSYSFQCFTLGNGFSHWSVTCPLCGLYFVWRTAVADLLAYATYCFWSHGLLDWTRGQKVTSSGSAPLSSFRTASDR